LNSEKHAQSTAQQNYFEGTEQVDLNRALKYFERKQKKNSLTTIEAETYLKMLTLKQESLKSSPTISSRRKLVDASDAAY
jgi:hypothetical protein